MFCCSPPETADDKALNLSFPLPEGQSSQSVAGHGPQRRDPDFCLQQKLGACSLLWTSRAVDWYLLSDQRNIRSETKSTECTPVILKPSLLILN